MDTNGANGAQNKCFMGLYGAHMVLFEDLCKNGVRNRNKPISEAKKHKNGVKKHENRQKIG
ncbi:MAG: hypothetical protein PHO14_10490 [Kiritimatiellae bacterium]|jgi:hypothetical protein|nr:hypothetical protein [Kiritimatiellia bacterium]MDD4342641.1 hypothetical protein [Kiritimatiellia bacterium]